MVSVARKAYDSALHQTMVGETAPTQQQLLYWIRGTVESVRLQGGVHHEWLKGYIATDGKRWQIWGGRPKGEGMPAFPSGRPAPAFPRIGSAAAATDNLDGVTSSASWYARWTARCLGVAPRRQRLPPATHHRTRRRRNHWQLERTPAPMSVAGPEKIVLSVPTPRIWRRTAHRPVQGLPGHHPREPDSH
jgi:hypothetical protein